MFSMLSFKKFFEYFTEALRWMNSVDNYNPGDSDYILILAKDKDDQKYLKVREEKIHGMMSHAIAHHYEFDQGFVKNTINQTIEYLNSYLTTENAEPKINIVLMKNVKDERGNLAYVEKNEKALEKISQDNEMKLGAILNLFDRISDKNSLRSELNPPEKHILDTFLVPLEKAYEAKVEDMMKNAVDVDRFSKQQIVDAIASGKILKLTVTLNILSGVMKRPIYLDFRSTAYISAKGPDEVATAHKLKKKDNHDLVTNMGSIGFWLNRFTVEIENPVLNTFRRDYAEGKSGFISLVDDTKAKKAKYDEEKKRQRELEKQAQK